MAKYAVFFSLKPETIKGFIDNPSDRAVVVSKLCESAGGRMDAYYFMFGPWDGFTIVDVPESKSAAAVSLRVSSSGAFARLETHELFEASEIAGLLSTAAGLSYSPPGS